MTSHTDLTLTNGQMVQQSDFDSMLRTVVHLVESEDNPSGTNIVELGAKEAPVGGVDLVEMAREIQKADGCVAATASGKLEIILEQMRFLQEQAKKILEDAARDAELHHAACNVVKRVGHVYYLYRRASGQRYFSILSPEEWGPSCPHEFLGAYILQPDMTFTPATTSGEDRRNPLQREDAARIRNLVKSATQHGASKHGALQCPLEAVIVRPRPLTPPVTDDTSD